MLVPLLILFFTTHQLSREAASQASAFKPEKTCPRVRMVPHLAHRDRCTFPSCHRLTSLLPAFPGGEKKKKQFNY